MRRAFATVVLVLSILMLCVPFATAQEVPSPTPAAVSTQAPAAQDTPWWKVLLNLLDSWFGLKTVWMPSASAIAVIVAITQGAKKLLRFAPILDKFLSGWASVGLNAIVSGLVYLLPAVQSEGLQFNEIVGLISAVILGAGGYEALKLLFKPRSPAV